jgi:putative selenium metabolism protein SsnA
MTLTVRGGTVVPTLVDPVPEALDVRIDAGRVTSLDPALLGAAHDGGATSDEVLDAAGCLVMPGLVCAHTHAYSALARGMPYRLAPPRDFVETLRRVWWRLDRALDEPSIRSSARVAAIEALRAGTTTLVDHHASPRAIDGCLDIVAEAFAEVGIRSVLAYEVTDRDGPGRAAAGVAENDRFLERVRSGRLPLARALVGAHASFTLAPATLQACIDVARRHAVGLHIHVAEDAADERDAETRFGVRVVQRLADAGGLTDRALLAHAVHLDEVEAALVRGSGATVVVNARSNLSNRVGRAPVERLGDHVALGTDGIGGDMFEESRVAFLAQRSADVVGDSAWALGALATGARLAARCFDEPELGGLSLGAPADLVVLDYRPPTPLTGETWPGHWIYGLSAAAVRDVVVAGRIVLRDRQPTLVAADKILAEARIQAGCLWDRLEAIDEHPFTQQAGP